MKREALGTAWGLCLYAIDHAELLKCPKCAKCRTTYPLWNNPGGGHGDPPSFGFGLLFGMVDDRKFFIIGRGVWGGRVCIMNTDEWDIERYLTGFEIKGG